MSFLHGHAESRLWQVRDLLFLCGLGGTAIRGCPRLQRCAVCVHFRGLTNEINEYMVQRAREVLEGAAKMYGLKLEIKPATTCVAALNSPELIELGTRIAKTLPSVKHIAPVCSTNGSEDMCVLMERVQQRGGQALEVLLGTPFGGGHHSNSFDLDEKVIQNGAEFFAAIYDALAAKT